MPTSEGVLESIQTWEDFPKRLLEAILEGIAKNPQDWVMVGMGFWLGYEGYDVMAWFMKNIKVPGTGALLDAQNTGGLGFIVDVSKASLTDWTLPMVASLAELLGMKTSSATPKTAADIKADPEKSDMAKNAAVWAHNLKGKLIMGCLGAITVYTLTRPGTIAGIGEIVKGVGEIVPL